MPIDERLLDLVCCPKCQGDLIYDKKREALICPRCKLLYPVKEDIPILLIEEAEAIDDISPDTN